MIKLNGWQRLWVFLSGSYLLVVLVITFSNLPTAGDFSSVEIFRHLSNQSLELIANAKEQWSTIVEDEISIPVPTELDQARINMFKTDYKNAVEATVQEKRIGHLFQAFIWWLAPSVLLYAFGLGIAWIRRGFRRDAP